VRIFSLQNSSFPSLVVFPCSIYRIDSGVLLPVTLQTLPVCELVFTYHYKWIDFCILLFVNDG